MIIERRNMRDRPDHSFFSPVYICRHNRVYMSCTSSPNILDFFVLFPPLPCDVFHPELYLAVQSCNSRLLDLSLLGWLDNVIIYKTTTLTSAFTDESRKPVLYDQVAIRMKGERGELCVLVEYICVVSGRGERKRQENNLTCREHTKQSTESTCCLNQNVDYFQPGLCGINELRCRVYLPGINNAAMPVQEGVPVIASHVCLGMMISMLVPVVLCCI